MKKARPWRRLVRPSSPAVSRSAPAPRGQGSTHLVAGLYEAARYDAPVLALSGNMPRKMQGVDYIQTTSPDLLFRDVSLYTESINSPEQAPAVIHQAIAAAYAGRGVAHLTLLQDVILAGTNGGVASVDTLRPRPEFAASAEDVARSRADDAAGGVLIMCGAGCHGAAAELRALSDRLKAPLIHSVKGQDIMPYDDPHWMGGVGMIGSKPVYNAVMSAELLLMVGTDYPYSNYLPNRPVVIQIDERPEVLGRRAPPCSACLARRGRRSSCSSISRAEDRHKLLEPDRGGAPRLGPQARPTGRSRAQPRPHPSTGGRPRGQRPRRPERGVRD